MRKTKLDTRSGKSADSVYGVASFGKNGALSSAKNSQILALEKQKLPSDEPDVFSRFLKQVFIFLPGTFLLFLADRMLDGSTYLIFLLPLALIIPILAKSDC